MTPWSPRLHQAVDLACRAHMGQSRKDPDHAIPYPSHTFGVAYVLASYDFPEDVVIAGLLHDVVEDQPAFEPHLDAFGARVVTLVHAVSEIKLGPGGERIPWRTRRDRYVEALREADPEAKAVACADKIHNMESIVLALDRGADMWASLRSTPEEQVHRLEDLRGAFAQGWSHPMLADFDRLLAELSARLP